MNLLVAWKKVLLFGAFGAVGCLAGWLVGEPYLYATSFVGDSAGAGRAPSLISKPVPPSSEAPPLPNDIRERIEKAGGKSGDVQISLIWYNLNDLDLHCKDPNGEVIFYKNPRARRSGGELDVDANADIRDGRGAPLTREPVENIYWPKNGAPAGHYQVFINHFSHRASEPNKTRFKVNVLHDGQRHEFEGDIENNGSPDNKRMIYEFELKARIVLLAPEQPVELRPATTVKVPVALRRQQYQGPVEVKVENLPEGVTAGKLTIPEGKDDGEIELKTTDSATEIKRTIKFVATGGSLTSSADVQVAVLKPAATFSLWTVVSIGIWTALLAVGLCLALLAGQNKYLGKSLFASGRVPLVLVILGAAAAGFVSGSIGQALFFVLLSLGAAKLGFLIGWVLLGALLGGGVSFFIPNLDGKKAMLAGLGGGLLGAIAFLIMSEVKDWIGRFGGAALLGFCIGLMVAVVEAAFRRAWLEVRFSEREVITVNLGPEPVKVGGDSKACTVWARGAAPIALRYWIRDGKVFCEDVPTKREETALNGDSRTAGGVTVVVRTSGTAPPLAASRPTAPLPPVPVPAARPQAVSAPPAPPAPKPQAAAPAAPPPAKTAAPDDDYDGMPMPMSPPPPPRPVAKSILDFDDDPRPAPAAKPPIPAPTAAKPPAPAPPKPPVPVPPPAKPQAAAPPTAPPAPAKPPVPTIAKPPAPASGPKTGDPDACPSCGRKSPGKPGSRYCMMCDKTF